MRELPELEIYRAMLAERFAGALITDFKTTSDREREHAMALELKGKMIWFVERRGPYLVFHLDNGKRLMMAMSDGSFMYCSSSDEELGEKPSITIEFEDRHLHFFGLTMEDLYLKSVKELETEMKSFGIDPLDKRLTPARFKARFSSSRKGLKSALMDRSAIAGIGSLYADEIAYAARLSPASKLSALSEDNWERLFHATTEILREAIAHGGTGDHPMFANDSLTGGFKDYLKVSGREGKPCERCGHRIERILVAKRKTAICPHCQSGEE
ncbi:Fpg/Nei family DNA glycosylase [Paenibacillus sp. HB172176]|uniref:Fpg/Nei family DNA glycosylase n=1 Tax=Paenibacillus sp. HB172176 TaxID=2493690 RepID=UPI00143B6ABB|nr:Fpg/Nei family DNA glycosylase [Paenibacillus sp. HB172176]